MKYLIVQRRYPEHSPMIPMVFANELVPMEMIPSWHRIISGGLCTLYPAVTVATDPSFPSITVRPEEDVVILRRYILYGMSVNVQSAPCGSQNLSEAEFLQEQAKKGLASVRSKYGK